MCCCKLKCAIITRALFLIDSLTSVWTVTLWKGDLNYWFLTILSLPLLVETIIMLKRGKGTGCRWFSPAIFLYLISTIPSIWILELNYQQDKVNLQCEDVMESVRTLIPTNGTLTLKLTNEDFLKEFNTACSNELSVDMHQSLLIVLIVGRWLLPLRGGITRDELSRLLLIFVGTAADILEFTSETLPDVKKNIPQMVYIILAVWTWSMLQFPLHLSVVNSKPDSDGEQGVQEGSFLSKYSEDIWSIVAALFIQDGPFLVVRLTVLIYFNNFKQMLMFFFIKNVLVIILNLYRLVIIWRESRSRAGRGSAVPCV